MLLHFFLPIFPHIWSFFKFIGGTKIMSYLKRGEWRSRVAAVRIEVPLVLILIRSKPRLKSWFIFKFLLFKGTCLVLGGNDGGDCSWNKKIKFKKCDFKTRFTCSVLSHRQNPTFSFLKEFVIQHGLKKKDKAQLFSSILVNKRTIFLNISILIYLKYYSLYDD